MTSEIDENKVKFCIHDLYFYLHTWLATAEINYMHVSKFAICAMNSATVINGESFTES